MKPYRNAGSMFASCLRYARCGAAGHAAYRSLLAQQRLRRRTFRSDHPARGTARICARNTFVAIMSTLFIAHTAFTPTHGDDLRCEKLAVSVHQHAALHRHVHAAYAVPQGGQSLTAGCISRNIVVERGEVTAAAAAAAAAAASRTACNGGIARRATTECA
eukprot:44949-Chlamydomonas_euryale.AAC.3